MGWEPKRDAWSEAILAVASIYAAILLSLVPGLLIAWWLPWWLGLPWVMACGRAGFWLMDRVDRSIYGPREK